MNRAGASAVLCALAMGAPVRGSSLLLKESFNNAAAPAWSLLGNAGLTGGGADPAGRGWLRLAANAGNQSGAAFDTTALPFAGGLDITFNYAIWGGSGADGLVIALVDGAQTPGASGGPGGSLGFAQSGATGGLKGAILGIGLDVFGNFASPTEGRQNGPGLTPDAVTIRGPGDGSGKAKAQNAVNYDFLTTSGTLAATPNGDPLQLALNTNVRPSTAADFREAEVIVDSTQLPNGRLPVTVILKSGVNGAPQTIVSKFDAYRQVLAFYGNDPARIPKNFKLAFTGSTGGSTDNIEVQNVQVDSLSDVAGFPAVPEPGTSVSLALGLFAMALFGRRWRLAPQPACAATVLCSRPPARRPNLTPE